MSIYQRGENWYMTSRLRARESGSLLDRPGRVAGQDLNTVGELLGHKSLEMTKRYAHLSPTHKAKSVTLLDRILSQIPPQIEATEKVVSLSL